MIRGVAKHEMDWLQLGALFFAAVAAVAAVVAIFQARGTSGELASVRDSLKSMLDRIEGMAAALSEASTRLEGIGKTQAATAETVKETLQHARRAHEHAIQNERVQALLRLRSLIYRLRRYADATLLDEEEGMRLYEFVSDFQANVAHLDAKTFERCWDASRKIGVFRAYLPPAQAIHAARDRWQVTNAGLLNQALSEIDAALPQ